MDNYADNFYNLVNGQKRDFFYHFGILIHECIY